MPRVMLDLETMGNKPGAAIIAIGACIFDTGVADGIGARFEARIDLEDAVKSGLQMDASTVKWWMEQSKEAQTAVMRPGHTLISVLAYFDLFLRDYSGHSDFEMWGNGSDFDNVLLGKAYEVVGLPLPWKFYKNRCYRTLKNLPGAPAQPKFEGLKHDALTDAVQQARHAMLILEWLGAKK